MNIDAYYSRASGSAPASDFPSPRMSSPIYPAAFQQGYQFPQQPMDQQVMQSSPQPYRYEDAFPQMNEVDRQRLLGLINSGPVNAPSAAELQQREQQQASAWLYNNMPRPELGPIDRQIYNEISQIYYRHYLNGTYGSPQMFNELQSTLDTIRQQRESVPQQTPIGTPVTMQYMGMGWQGTPVVETSYQPTPAQTISPSQATLEARIRNMLIKRGTTTPRIGGAGGLPGPRTGGPLPLAPIHTTRPYEIATTK